MDSTTLKKGKKGFVLVLVASMTALAGCELIVDFDRTKIVTEDTGEGGATDATTDTGTESDTGTADTGADTGTTDSGIDATDAASDADGDV